MGLSSLSSLTHLIYGLWLVVHTVGQRPMATFCEISEVYLSKIIRSSKDTM